ncbi:hypothetical protein HPB51_013601 [Rhipicephalus microplus]|uniref:Uncharacterized protein n=1 Tax=Rhipicephalus microplus TaxID=6941 RepID=A0A9J6DVY5_RHIMP|nr:hypothetical protein HPB51_013601 [Rhipicephalus microplus]
MYYNKVGEQAHVRDLERHKAALAAEVGHLKQVTLQHATCISQLKCELGRLTHEHEGLKHTQNVYKSRATTIIDEKDHHISGLEDEVHSWEKLLADAEQHLRNQQQQSVFFIYTHTHSAI